MNSIASITRIPHEVKTIDAETVALTFYLPAASLNAFIMMFSCFADLFRGVAWKAKTNPKTIQIRNEAKQADIEKMTERYNAAVIKIFMQYIDKGNTARQAMSLTVSEVHKEFPFSSFDQVKNCLSKNKLLKNTGYYKSRHKFD